MNTILYQTTLTRAKRKKNHSQDAGDGKDKSSGIFSESVLWAGFRKGPPEASVMLTKSLFLSLGSPSS